MDISIIGGDLRIAKLVEMYAKENNRVYTYGMEKYFSQLSEIEFDNNIIMCKNIEEVIDSSKYIISSIPLSRDNIYINAPFSDNKIELEDVLKKLSNINRNNVLVNKYFIAGKIPKEFHNKNIENIDLLENEEFNILNSIPTVEGTIKIIIQEREDTIHESNILICGFGRIGKILCDRLKSMGANIYCAARKEVDLAWIREEGYIPLKYNEIKEMRK